MREGFAIPLAVTAAATAAAGLAVLLLWLARPSWMSSSSDVLVVYFFVVSACFAYSMLVGIPIALVLKHKNRFRLAPMTIAGAIAGSVPGLLIFAGDWLTYTNYPDELALTAVLAFCGGLAGAAGGASFFGAHRLMSPNNSFNRKPLRGSGQFRR